MAPHRGEVTPQRGRHECLLHLVVQEKRVDLVGCHEHHLDVLGAVEMPCSEYVTPCAMKQ